MKLKLLFFICMLVQLTTVSIAKGLKNDSTKKCNKKLNDTNVTAAIMDSEHLDDDSKVWVLAQARLETGWYTSKIAKTHNNLFGLYDSKNRRYYRFKNWQDSIKAYAELIQYRRKSGESYPHFLQRIKYAKHPGYIDSLKCIVKTHGNKPKIN